MKKLLTILIITALWQVGLAQFRLEITHHSKFLLPNGQLFMASNLNQWNPNDPAFQLKLREDGVYFIELPDSLKSFEYKFTQGGWTYVEGTAEGNSRPNRYFDKTQLDAIKTLKLSIEGWEKMPSYKFIVNTIPENTPVDASIYIAGNFNNWNPANPSYKLQKQMDGTYRIEIFTDVDKLEYKFTRGSWVAVEGKESGKARPNRLFYRSSSADNRSIKVDILSWEDLSGTFNFYSIYDLLMLFSVFQGLLLVITIPTIQDYNKAANRWLVILIAFSAIMILIRVVGSYREVAQTYSKLLLIPDFLFFLYAPLFYLYVQKLLFHSEKLPRYWYFHLIPFALQLLVYSPYFFMEHKIFQYKIVNHESDIQTLFIITGAAAFIFNAIYWWVCRKAIEAYKKQYHTGHSYEQNLEYLNTILFIQAFCLAIWFLIFLAGVFGSFFEINLSDIFEKSVDAIWLIFSTIIYFLGYFAINQPEIFKLSSPEIDVYFQPNQPIMPHPPIHLQVESGMENLQILKERVTVFMQKNKPYTNPQLTLNDLANKLKMQPHILSKIINDGFEKNFFDFINTYRIEEFKERMNDPNYKNYTLLGIAFEVGFNSKTAFNRSFKKITNTTPSEYHLHLEKN